MSFWRKEVIQPALDRDVETAIAEQKAILARDPKNPQAHFALGTLAYFKGEITAAIELFIQAIELDSSYAAPHMSLGRLYALQGKYDLAWKHAREAARLGNNELVEQLGRYTKLK